MPESRSSAPSLLLNLQPFTYRGPTSGVTLADPDDPKAPHLERMLFDGEPVELPADHPHVKALVAQKFIAPIAPAAAAAIDSENESRPTRAPRTPSSEKSTS